MAFVLLFAVGMLVVPIALDIQRYRRDNILRTSGRDILEFPIVASLLGMLGRLGRLVNDLVATIVSFILLILLGYIALKILGFLSRHLFDG